MPERQTLRDSDDPLCPELCLPMHSSLPSHGARRPKPAPGVSTTNGLGSGSPVVVAKINNGHAIGAFWGPTMARLLYCSTGSGPRAGIGAASLQNWRLKDGKCSASTSWDLARRINRGYAKEARWITRFGGSKPLPFLSRSSKGPPCLWGTPLEASVPSPQQC